MTEFQIIQRELVGHKERFIARLTRNLRVRGACVIWTGYHRGGKLGNEYPCMSFRIDGRSMPFSVHRIFLTLRLCRPINRFMEAGHYYCHNSSCVRHVEEQTRAQNLRERDARYQEKRADYLPF